MKNIGHELLVSKSGPSSSQRPAANLVPHRQHIDDMEAGDHYAEINTIAIAIHG